MINNALQFLLHTLLGLFTLVLMLRFYLQLTRAPFHNPASQAIVVMTNFLVRPVRRIVPAWGNIDLSTLLLAYLIQFLLEIGTLWLNDFPLFVAGSPVFLALLGLAAVDLLKLSIYIFMYAVVIQAVLSWIQTYTPITTALDALTRPVLQPIRRVLPTAGGIDFSPLVVIVLAQLLLIVLVAPLEQQFIRLF
ncbi:MAG TPA: YggT family protein [Methylophilaceae bacterium]|nr:YggT family protein [Methylophilaceae bacterium]